MDKIVIDTKIIVSALRSSRGAENKLMTLVGSRRFKSCISVALILEYEEVLHRHFPDYSRRKIADLLDYICTVSEHTRVYYLWRPFLKDPDDDMILELAVSSRAKFIITYNKKDFKGIDKFDIAAVTPKEYLNKIGIL